MVEICEDKSDIEAINVWLKLTSYGELAPFMAWAGRAWETKTNETDEMPLLPVVIIAGLKVKFI